MIAVVRAIEGADGEDLLEVGGRVAAVHAGQGLLAIGDVAPILVMVRSPDRHLRFEREIEEGARGAMERGLRGFGHSVMADHEEADLPADGVELAGGTGNCRRIRALEALQVENGNAVHRHDASLVDGAVPRALAIASSLTRTPAGTARPVARMRGRAATKDRMPARRSPGAECTGGSRVRCMASAQPPPLPGDGCRSRARKTRAASRDPSRTEGHAGERPMAGRRRARRRHGFLSVRGATARSKA